MSLKLKYHQNFKITKTYILPELKFHQDRNFTKTEIGLYNWTFKFGTDCFGLVIFDFMLCYGHL